MKYLPVMHSFLQQPYPFSDNAGRRLAVCAGIGLFITLFLVLFEPFGFNELAVLAKCGHALLFGVVTFVLSSFFQVALPKFFPPPFREEEWRSWKEILYLLATTAFIGAGNYGLMLFLYPQNRELSSFLQAELITLQVGIFPICFVVFMKQMTLYRRYAMQAKEVTDDIRVETQQAAEQVPVQRTIILRGDNQKEELTVLPEDLLCISSADNYVNVQYTENDKQKSVLMRSSLKRMEEQLPGHASFFRCHRMYVVNLALVTTVSGNAQGLKLHLPGLEEPVPVSRSLTETVKEKLHQLSHSPRKA